MRSPFLGMDPYLEGNAYWPSFHHLLADEIMAQLNAQLIDKYYADVEVKTVLQEVGIATTQLIYPDAAVVESNAAGNIAVATEIAPVAPVQRVALAAGQSKLRTVQVYLTEENRLVTAIEILSPANKRGQGLGRYRDKRDQILHTSVHLAELDFLRAGQRPGWELEDPPLDTDYVCLVNRSGQAERVSEIWPVALNEPLPTLPIPLLHPDSDVLLDLGQTLQAIYSRGAYGRRIDYRQPLPPPEPRPQMSVWLQKIDIGQPNYRSP